MTHVWLLMGISCPDCNCNQVRVLSTEPTEQDHADLRDRMGGMHCIKTVAALAKFDGARVGLEED